MWNGMWNGMCRYQDRGLPFCYVGYFDGMEEGSLRANVIEAKVNDVSVKYLRARPGDESEDTYYGEGEIVPAERIIQAAGFKVRGMAPACDVRFCWEEGHNKYAERSWYALGVLGWQLLVAVWLPCMHGVRHCM